MENTKKKSPRFLPEVRERAVRMVLEHQGECDSQWKVIASIAAKFGCSGETLRSWVRKEERNRGLRRGTSTQEQDRLKELEREVRELRRYRRGFRSLMRDHVRAPEPGQAKTWLLQSQNSRGWYETVALRRLVTSRKDHFRWRNPSENPYILRDQARSIIELRYPDVAFAMSNA